MKHFVFFVLIVLFATCPADADARSKLSKKEARKIALEKVPGEVVEFEIEKEDGTLVYEFKIRKEDGTLKEIELDAYSGAVLEVEDESEDADSNAAEEGDEADEVAEEETPEEAQ